MAAHIGQLVEISSKNQSFFVRQDEMCIMYINVLKYCTIFDQAFMSMFQILTQEGWIEVMHGVIEETMTGGWFLKVLCAIYFILYHQFVTVVSKGQN